MWIQTYSGTAVDLANPRVEQIDARDLAWSLSMICRYNGHTARHYSVAEHSLLVAMALERDGFPPGIVLGGLLHDVIEAYIGDVAAPLKWASPTLARGLEELADRLEPVICEALDIERVCLHDPAVKAYDRRILHDERDALLGQCGELLGWQARPWNVDGQPLGVEVRGLPAQMAAYLWGRELLVHRPDLAHPGAVADQLWPMIGGVG